MAEKLFGIRFQIARWRSLQMGMMTMHTFYLSTMLSMNYAQLIKIRENGKVVAKKKRVIYGDPDMSDIETTYVENFNGILKAR